MRTRINRILLALLGVLSILFVTSVQNLRAAIPQPASREPKAEAGRVTLPAGTVLYLRLESAVSTRASHLHDAVTARVVREVRGPQKVAIPLGSVVRGRIEKLIPSSDPNDRARMLLKFSELDIPGLAPIKLAGHLKEVENGREKTLPDGTIQGVLASELPLAHLEIALGKLGKEAEELRKLQEKALGKSDTSIAFPVGTDLAFVLDKPLAVDDKFSPTAASVLSPDISAAVERLLAQAPNRSSSKDGEPGDPLNLVLIGNVAEIRQAFKEAGWTEPQKKNSKSILDTIQAVAGDQGYGAAPVSDLYLFGRAEDLANEKMLNTFAKRHHLRLWRSPVTAPDGREIWLGAATHDNGLDIRPGVASHAIDADLDEERSKVGADLLVTGRVIVESLVTGPSPLSEGLTATGAPWRTDGKLIVVELKPQ